MRGGGKAGHVRAHFANDHFGHRLAHARDRVQMRDRFSKREASGLNLVVEGLDTLFESVEEGEEVRQNKALRIACSPRSA